MSEAAARHPSLDAWTALRASGAARGALVTLVRAGGGASGALGLRLAVTDDGRTFGSVTMGGCADGRALAAARRVLDTGRAEAVTLPLSEEDAVALGLGCAGEVDLLVEPVAMRAAGGLCRTLDAARTAEEAGCRVALATPLSGARGRLLVQSTGASSGETTDPARDGDGVALALGVLAAPDPVAGIHERDGGRWFIEPVMPRRVVVIVGATEIAAVLCDLVRPLGWRTILLDPRDEVLAEARFASAAERLPSMPAEAVCRLLAAGGAPAVVIVAHDYRVELPVLRAALAGDAVYVGMLGSRRRGARMREMLADEGLAAGAVSRLRTPIGLDIGAQGAAEIAVSIVAELIATWRGASRAAP